MTDSSQIPHEIASTTIGFCGLGAMGFGMATHLLKQGYKVKGFDVFAKTMERWQEAGGIVCTSLIESAKDVQFYVCMVASMPQAEVALFGKEEAKGIVEGLPNGATLLLCSTVPAQYARSVEEKLKTVGREDVSFIDSPVSGGAIRAAAGTLSIMAGASPEALEKGSWLLSELSEKLYIVPGGVGGGSNLKMAHQVLAGIQILATSESLGLAARLGLNAEEVVKEVIGSEAWSWMFENRSPRTLKEDYYPGASALTIILKDVGIITSTSRTLTFPLPLSLTTEQVLVSGLSLGYGPHDDAGVVRLYHPSSPISSVTQPYQPTNPGTLTNLSSSSSASSTPPTPDLIIKYLRAVHLVSAAEAIAFSHHLGLDLGQFRDLVNDAAGGSAMFKQYFDVLSSEVKGQKTSASAGEGGVTLSQVSNDLAEVLQEARKVECPMWLGTAAYSILGHSGLRCKGKEGEGVGGLMSYWA